MVLLNASFCVVKKGCLIDSEIAGRVHNKSPTVLGQPILAGNQFTCVGTAIAVDPQIDVALMTVGPILITGDALIFHDEVFLQRRDIDSRPWLVLSLIGSEGDWVSGGSMATRARVKNREGDRGAWRRVIHETVTGDEPVQRLGRSVGRRQRENNEQGNGCDKQTFVELILLQFHHNKLSLIRGIALNVLALETLIETF